MQHIDSRARRITRPVAIMITAAALAASAASGPAGAAITVAVAPPLATEAGYATPVVIAPQGGPLTLVNLDPVDPHNLVAMGVHGSTSRSWCTQSQKNNNTCPLFWSPTTEIGVTSVEGLDQTESGGSYPFFCSIHPNMTGTLMIL